MLCSFLFSYIEFIAYTVDTFHIVRQFWGNPDFLSQVAYMVVDCFPGIVTYRSGNVLREQFSIEEDLAQQILCCGESSIRRESKQLHSSWKILQKNRSFQQGFPQGIRRIGVIPCRCFFQKGNRTGNVLGKLHTLKQCFPQEVFRILYFVLVRDV